ncbi:MAG: class I SAM-dependent methyltransferase [Acidimicrobiales bacterium]
MDRVPEPELMDDSDQARAYSEGDFAEAHQLFADLAGQRFGPISGDVLDLGCGPGDPTVRFGLANPDARITGVDAAASMLALAVARVAEAGLSERIAFEQRYLPDPELEGRRYGAVISNSLLHHLVDPGSLWQTVAACARPGSPVLVMDLCRPDQAETVEALVARHATGAPDVLRTDFRNSLLAAYRPDDIRRQLACCGLVHLEVELVSDRHLLVSGRR